MDALMIFDSNNYLVYLKYNGIFLDELSDIVREYNLIASSSRRKIKKMLMTDSNELQNCIVLIFAPYIASIRVLQSECPPINIFPEQDSIRIVHTQYLDYIFLYLLDMRESEAICQVEKRLNMFVSIAKILFGASICDIKIGGEQTSLMNALFNRWRTVENAPIFLVEAIERIILSSTIQTEFTNLMFQCLYKFRNNINSFSEEMPSHCMLFVENKLVNRVSSPDAAKISRIDLVLLTLFVDTIHSCKYKESSRDGHDALIQKKSSDEYFGDDESLENENFNYKKSQATDRKESLSSNYQGNSIPLRNWKHFDHRLIFLRSSVDPQCLVPYYLRLVNIQDSMSLLIISQLPSTMVTYHIHKLWHILNLLQYRPKELGFSHELGEFDTSLNRLRKIMGDLKKKSDIIRKLCNKLDQLYKSNVRKYILGSEGEEITAKLDSLCSSVCSLLRFVYSRKIYFHHMNCVERLENETELISRMMNVKQACSQVALDYGEYLHVKAQRNISLESFLDIAPDLVAFIYLDRNSNEFIMATLDDYQDALGDSELLNSNIANNVLPRAVQNAYHQLSNGRTSSSWSENGLFYNYLMWFEDDEGKLVESCKNRLETPPFANMMCVDFIEQIHKTWSVNHRMSAIQKGKKTLACYELFHIVKFNLKNDHDRLLEAKKLAFRLKKITSNIYDHFSTSK